MRRIELTHLFNDIHVWFYHTFGQPEHWTSIITEPDTLESNYNWAVGQMLYNDGAYDTVTCIWCNEEAYTAYALRWL